MKNLLFVLCSLMSLLAVAKTDVLCIYYPEWHAYPEGDIIFGKGHTEWDFVNTAKPLFPGHEQPIKLLAGNPDDANPADVAKEIDLAADAGIDVFVYDWYWANHKPIEHEALEQGFLKAPNKSRMKFALMWANHNRSDVFRSAPGVSTNGVYFWKPAYDKKEFLEVVDYCITNYFNQKEYYLKDGKLFFSIYSTKPFIEGLGGPEGTKAAFAEAQAKVKEAGLPPIHFSAMVRGSYLPKLAEAAGFESTSAYNVTPYDYDDTDLSKTNGETRLIFTHEELAKLHRPVNEKINAASNLPHIRIISKGWDSTPRCSLDVPFPYKQIVYPYGGVVTGMKPEVFKQIVQQMIADSEADKKKPGAILINAWNEYTEGAYLMPDEWHQDGFLRALQQAVQEQKPSCSHPEASPSGQ